MLVTAHLSTRVSQPVDVLLIDTYELRWITRNPARSESEEPTHKLRGEALDCERLQLLQMHDRLGQALHPVLVQRGPNPSIHESVIIDVDIL